MDFAVTRSPFSEPATVGTAGYRPPPRGERNQRFVLQVDSVMLKSNRERDRRSKSGYASTLHYTVQGFRATGRSLVIGRTAYGVVEPIGSFGHEITHDGDVSRWRLQLEGAEEIAKGLYGLSIPVSGQARVVPTVTPVERRVQASLHAGLATPVAALANDYTAGVAVHADLGYRLASELWLVGFAGYNGFGGKSGIDDSYWVNVSVNVRYFYALGFPVFGYASAGPGLYVEKGGATDFGANAGVGVEYRLGRAFALQLGADYHWVRSDVQFVTAEAGIVARF
jgi:hypothetical protein